MAEGKLFPTCRLLLASTVVLLSGCYYAFDVSPAATKVPRPRRSSPEAEMVTYEAHAPRYLGNTVGEPVNAKRYCAHPLRVDRHVEPGDLVASAATGFLYQAETVHVTCEVPRSEDEGVPQ